MFPALHPDLCQPLICCAWCLWPQPAHGLLSLSGSVPWPSNSKLCYPSPSERYLPYPPCPHSCLLSSFPLVFRSSVTCSHIPGRPHLHPTIWQALTSTSHRARGTFRQSSRDCACVAVDEPMILFPRLWKASRSSGCLVGMGCSDTALGTTSNTLWMLDKC